MLDHLCGTTGLDLATLQSLVDSGRLPGVVNEEGRGLGVYADALPTADELRALGVTGLDAYRLEDFVDHELPGNDDDDDDEGEGNSYSLTWHDTSSPDK
jgi:hypothetical protein